MGKNPLKYASPELGRRIVEQMGDAIGRSAARLLAEVAQRCPSIRSGHAIRPSHTNSAGIAS